MATTLNIIAQPAAGYKLDPDTDNQTTFEYTDIVDLQSGLRQQINVTLGREALNSDPITAEDMASISIFSINYTNDVADATGISFLINATRIGINNNPKNFTAFDCIFLYKLTSINMRVGSAPINTALSIPRMKNENGEDRPYLLWNGFTYDEATDTYKFSVSGDNRITMQGISNGFLFSVES